MKRALTGNLAVPAYLYNYILPYLENDSNGDYSTLNSNLELYYDDLNLHSPIEMSFEEHLADLDELLKRISRAGFRINIDKSRFAECLEHNTFKILGYEVGYKTIKPNEDKLKALRELPIPQTLKGLQAFLGSVQYIRQTLPLSVSGSVAILNEYA